MAARWSLCKSRPFEVTLTFAPVGRIGQLRVAFTCNRTLPARSGRVSRYRLGTKLLWMAVAPMTPASMKFSRANILAN